MSGRAKVGKKSVVNVFKKEKPTQSDEYRKNYGVHGYASPRRFNVFTLCPICFKHVWT